MALAQTEQDHTARVATAWEQLAGLFGYRRRPELGAATFEMMATLLIATLHGLIVMALSTPDIATDRVQASPFGAAGKEECSLAAMGLAGIALTFLEPDPAITWDDQRLADIRQALSSCMPPNSNP